MGPGKVSARSEGVDQMAIHAHPKIAWVLGDPAGIGPEIIAKSLADSGMRHVCQPVIVGPAWLLQQAMRIAKVSLQASPCEVARLGACPPGMIPVVDDGWPALDVSPGTLSAAAGKLSIEMLRRAVEMAKSGAVDAVVFGPLNKEALRLGGSPHGDEHHLVAGWLGETEFGEINAVTGLFTTRVTSHVPLKDVPSLLHPDKIVRAVKMLHVTLRWAGIPDPIIAVAALNPHGGEQGLFGDEEQRVIEPGVAKARAAGFAAVGPFPADTIFVRARRGQFHGVVTMYHDQGQIATKLLGFDRGVTIMGGISLVIMTPAHGTAFDIAGKGIAKPEAFQAAVRLAAQLAGRRRA
jgi:4-hydroxythreonine-4-phosphate dehydrogenase